MHLDTKWFRLLRGKHRRVRFANLMHFKAKRDQASRQAMEALAQQAQELGMGYQ